jgi:hypothetical protein
VVADPFMKLTSLSEQTTMVGEGAGSGNRFSPLIGLFGLYTAIGSRMQFSSRTPNRLVFLLPGTALDRVRWCRRPYPARLASNGVLGFH